jgi:hypothetical protein
MERNGTSAGEKRKNMNAKQLNQQHSVVGFLDQNGFQPTSKKGHNYWYISMIRDLEVHPSFKVDTTKNLWYDHGSGVGGTLIDLACQIFKTGDVKEVIRLITGGFSSFHPQKTVHVPTSGGKSKLRIVNVGCIQDAGLITYLNLRGVSVDVALQYCKELTYSNQGHVFKGIGFKNHSGGYELRSNGFKSCIAPKDISFIENNGVNLVIFEGFMDFLSYLMLPVFHVADANFLVLNSLSLLGKASAHLANHDSRFLFLDNDQAGFKAAASLKLTYPRVIDMSPFYAEHKDLNDFLIQNKEGHE